MCVYMYVYVCMYVCTNDFVCMQTSGNSRRGHVKYTLILSNYRHIMQMAPICNKGDIKLSINYFVAYS